MSEEKKKELIFEKMAAIMKDVGPIAKDQTNTFHKYKFRGIDDVYNAVQEALVKHKVFTLPRLVEESHEVVQRGDKIQVVRFIVMEYVFFAEDGSCVVAKVPSEGIDSGDKAVFKALAGAHKYCLLQALCIPTEEKKDAEGESLEREAPKKTKEKIAPKEKKTIKMTLTDGSETMQSRTNALKMFAKMEEKISKDSYVAILKLNDIDDLKKCTDNTLSMLWKTMVEAYSG